jgi:nucleotide-binding universal stress UspA family protein
MQGKERAMNKVKKILAPTDLSELSQAGVRYALEEASSSGSEVIAYNVVGYQEAVPYYEPEVAPLPYQVPTAEEAVEEHRKHLAKFLQENFADLIAKTTVRQEVAIGTPFRNIVEKAAAEKVDMIIMSTHGRTGFLHTLIGSVAEKVVRLAACPVLTVRPKREALPHQAAA